jgi:protein TonB
VKTIARVQRNADDKPLTPVVLEKVSIVPEGQALPPLPGAAASGTMGALFPPTPKVLATPPKMVNISAGVAVGLLIARTPPAYPADAKSAGVQGTVVLEAIIGRDGLVQDLKVVSGPDLLQQAAVDAVKTWRYKPYLLNDEPVEVRTTINVIFTLGR